MPNAVVSREVWLAARRAHLEKEKAFTRQRDALVADRQKLPWVRVDKDYRFQSAGGELRLIDLFGDASQLIVQHFMLGPGWDEGCPMCSFWGDNFNGTTVHMAHRDVSFVAVSRGELARIEAYRQRMGWTFPWVSSLGSDFNFDFHVSFTEQEMQAGQVQYNYRSTTFPSSEAPGVSVFCRNDQAQVFHTYSCYARGLDNLNGAYHYIDLTPKGRDEDGLPYPMAWVRRHDQYDG
ncbi:MAG: thioredoxin family protein [Pseudomonadota bacterium]|nr:thioredoxin family protein [Pseudomonadota bacterium]